MRSLLRVVVAVPMLLYWACICTLGAIIFAPFLIIVGLHALFICAWNFVLTGHWRVDV
jgi:hypothetical protein